MSLVPALGFTFFGVCVGFTLVYWYVVRRIRRALRQKGVVGSMVRSVVSQLPADAEGFELLFAPEYKCPCCGVTVQGSMPDPPEPAPVTVEGKQA